MFATIGCNSAPLPISDRSHVNQHGCILEGNRNHAAHDVKISIEYHRTSKLPPSTNASKLIFATAVSSPGGSVGASALGAAAAAAAGSGAAAAAALGDAAAAAVAAAVASVSSARRSEKLSGFSAAPA